MSPQLRCPVTRDDVAEPEHRYSQQSPVQPDQPRRTEICPAPREVWPNSTLSYPATCAGLFSWGFYWKQCSGDNGFAPLCSLLRVISEIPKAAAACGAGSSTAQAAGDTR
ncbi:hypothetical protein DNTS_001760 [Danionella cerebrum]|uniref:Uncharacterized protein n=1 Tax=Danionella cerebrum TaxID=2873325 RepID=A0A553MNN5_9TELE|nr:hypothetical protein DNTS_001760 [Danionella translucida]